MSLTLSFDIIDSQSEIASNLLNALLPDVTKYFDKVSNKLIKTIPSIIVSSIISQPEYSALLSGTLQYELGIPDPANRLNEILTTIKEGYSVQQKPVTAKSTSISGGIKIQMIKKDFSDLISLGASTIVTEKGEKLNWLEWLLIEGDTIIISDHIFILGPSKYSRTGFGIMRETLGGFWRVPPEYAGSINNNWITRGINAASGEIEKTIEQALNM